MTSSRTPVLRRVLLCLIVAIAAFGSSQQLSAQRLALKTNTIDWLMLSPNLTLEARLSSRFSLQLGIASNPTHISIANVQLTNFRVEPELRYWFNRPMARHFIALSATAGTFNLRYKDHHFLGDAVGAGISYGYALVLSDHWNVEFELGAGIANVSAKNYYGADVPETKNYTRWLPVPIRAGLSFAYIFK
ncbi:MAG: DUF3575 domain-containing protein [Muribaculaceae bacterium]|nr:DUF3575 domain-containing protein [Muribaculaceae bacterium]MDE6526480.1 DUF3575 domain-containing protein [Muribaculaceae bacterium]MDE6612398.1 DUF3575 domain-containing protein [Muribaculaceae bacterium]